jgi:TonB-dependent receptor
MTTISSRRRQAPSCRAIFLSAIAPSIAVFAAPAAAQVAPESDGSEIVVSGSVLQNQAEVQTRRNATGIVDSANRDEIGALPDITIAESLRRITGVTTVYNDDIGQFASIRGSHPDFVPVTLNGMILATTGDLGEGTRKVNLQVIPGDAVQQLLVYKTLAPNLEAGALAGLIDIRTISALDPRRSLLSVTGGASYSTYMSVDDDNSWGHDKDSPYGYAFSGVFAPRFGPDDSLGLVVTGMYEMRPRTQSNNAIVERLYYTDGGTPTTPDSADWNGFGVPESFVSHNYTNRFTKWGITARLDWQPTDRVQSSLFGFAYFSEEEETRNTNRAYRLDQPRSITATTGTLRARSADVQWRWNTFERDQRGIQWLNDMAIGDRENLSLDLSYTYAWFRSDRPYAVFVYNAGSRLSYDLDNLQAPFTYDNPAAFAIPANYNATTLYRDSREAKEDVYEGKLDYTFNNGIDDRGLGFAAGAAYRELNLQRDNSGVNYVNGAASLANYSFVPSFASPGYGSNALWLDADRFWADVVPGAAVNQAATRTTNLQNDYSYREKVAAAYVDVNYATDQIRVDLGARLDHADFTATMAQIVEGVLRDAPVAKAGKDTHLLPYATLLWSFTPSLRLKAAATQTLGRPNPETIATVENVDETELTISRGNPDIQPRRSTNLDLGLEYFFNAGQGMVTLTGFYKKIRDDILTLSEQQVINGQTYVVTQPVNGDDSTLKGVEFGVINNNFANVAPWLDGFGASANLIWVEGETTYYDGESFRTRDQLQYQAEIAGNAAVFYALDDGSELRLAMNHQGEYLEEFAANSWGDIIIRPFTTFDLTARWAVTPNVQLRLEGRNIFNTDRRRNVGPDGEFYRAGLEVGSTWYLRANFRM